MKEKLLQFRPLKQKHINHGSGRSHKHEKEIERTQIPSEIYQSIIKSNEDFYLMILRYRYSP